MNVEILGLSFDEHPIVTIIITIVLIPALISIFAGFAFAIPFLMISLLVKKIVVKFSSEEDVGDSSSMVSFNIINKEEEN